MTKLEEIKERLEKATPGPWHIGQLNESTDSAWIESTELQDICEVVTRNDEPFICSAPTDIAYLLTKVEEAKEMAEFYAEAKTYSLCSDRPTYQIVIDKGQKARTFLESLK